MDESSNEFRIVQVAELPQFLGRPPVLEQDLVNIEGIHLTTPEAVNRRADVFNQPGELSVVEYSRHSLAGTLAVGLRGHNPR